MAWLVARAGSQAELARKSELLPATISDYVRGENEPKLTNVLKMLRGLRVQIEGMEPRPDPIDGLAEEVRQAVTMMDQAMQLLHRAEQAEAEPPREENGQR